MKNIPGETYTHEEEGAPDDDLLAELAEFAAEVEALEELAVGGAAPPAAEAEETPAAEANLEAPPPKAAPAASEATVQDLLIDRHVFLRGFNNHYRVNKCNMKKR